MLLPLALNNNLPSKGRGGTMKYSATVAILVIGLFFMASNGFAEIDLDYLEATGGNIQVVITWGTYSEVDNRGFNIYRS